jgi:hypothetical protein
MKAKREEGRSQGIKPVVLAWRRPYIFFLIQSTCCEVSFLVEVPVNLRLLSCTVKPEGIVIKMSQSAGA